MLYKDFTEKNNTKTLQKNDFSDIKKNIKPFIELSFKKEYNFEENHKFKFEGTNIIIRETIIKHIENILKIDEKYAPFKILELEEKFGYSTEIETEINSQPQNITIRGIFDRLDKKNDIVRLIDYKTGAAKKKFSSIESLFEAENSTRNRTVLQIFYYCLIYKQKFGTTNFKPGVYNIREMFSKKFDPDIIFKKEPINKDNMEFILAEYKSYLSQAISNIFDPEIPFTQTENEHNCAYCDYKNICNK